MAGRKQHYIPQLLQKGFTFSGAGKKPQLYQFSKNLKPFSSSTEGTGAMRDFYSNPIANGSDVLDDLITEFEATFLDNELPKFFSKRRIRCNLLLRRGTCSLNNVTRIFSEKPAH